MKGNIGKYYCFEFLSGMFFIVPVMVLFWQENGLSLTQIMVLQSLFSVLVVLLEVPTGYLADLTGRKKTLLLSAVFLTSAMAAYGVCRNFWQFLAAEVLFALSVSLNSGTAPALLYDSLKQSSEEGQFIRIRGNGLFLGITAMGLSSICGGILGQYSYRLTIFASIPFFLLLTPLALSMQEPPDCKLQATRGYAGELLGIVKTALVNNRDLRWFMLFSAVICGFNHSALWLYQPYFQLSGLDVVYFGVVFAAFQITAALAAKHADTLSKKWGLNTSLLAMVLLISAGFFLMSRVVALFSFIFVLLLQFVRGFSDPVLANCINRMTTSRNRATVLSIQSMAGSMLYAFILPFIGWIADAYSILQAFTVLGASSLVIGLAAFLTVRKCGTKF